MCVTATASVMDGSTKASSAGGSESSHPAIAVHCDGKPVMKKIKAVHNDPFLQFRLDLSHPFVKL
jgi:hypothetical protein